METVKRHPLVDAVTDRVVRVENRSSIVRLSTGLAELLEDRQYGDRVVVLVTPEGSALTVAVRAALIAFGARWLVKQAPGVFRDGLTGLLYANLDAAVLGHPIGRDGSASRPRASFFDLHAPAVDGADRAVQLTIDASVVHEAYGSIGVGQALVAIAKAVGRTVPRVWGWSEPLMNAWDPWVLAQHVRHDAPETSRVFVEGDGLSGVLTYRFGEHGLEETLSVTTEVAGGREGLDAAINRLTEVLVTLDPAYLPAFALVLARVAAADRLVRASDDAVPNPCALVIGTASARLLEIGPDSFPEHEVRVVGDVGREALVLTLGDSRNDGWDALHAALEQVGIERMPMLLGSMSGRRGATGAP